MEGFTERSAQTLAFGCSVLGLLLSTPCELRTQALDACAPASAVKAALDKIPTRQSPTQTDWQFHEQQLAAIQALLKEHPDDLFIERRYINTMNSFEDREKIIAEFKARHEQAPDNPEWSYLYGEVLIGRQSSESIKLFDEALDRAPKFSWPHLSLVTIYSSPVFSNKEQAISHVKAFLQACPESFDGYRSLGFSDDKGMIREGAQKLRAILQPRADPEALKAYRTLWSLEFKLHSPSEYDPLRKQVADDLKRIRALNLQDEPEWYEAMEEGYKLVNDQKQSDWAKDERVTRFPRPYELGAMSKWGKDHKWPADDDPAEKKRTFYSDLLRQSAEWAKERPNDINILWYHRNALEYLDDAAPADVVATVDKTLEVAKANAGPGELDSSWYFDAAELLAKKHLQPERVVDLAKKGLSRLEIESKRPENDLYATKENAEQNAYDRTYYYIEDMGFLIDGYLESKQSDQAQTTLAQMSERLDGLKARVGDNDRHKKSYARKDSAYWGFMARLAELQNRKLDAMAYYQSALLDRFRAEDKPQTGVKDELADNAHALWRNLGGTEEAWMMWYGRKANELAQQAALIWENTNLPLPAFELVDLKSNTWQPANLKGKVTFLNFWASW